MVIETDIYTFEHGLVLTIDRAPVEQVKLIKSLRLDEHLSGSVHVVTYSKKNCLQYSFVKNHLASCSYLNTAYKIFYSLIQPHFRLLQRCVGKL